MSDTKIEWADCVWNPIIGCSKCSPGCLNCYAERMAKRLYWMGMSYLPTHPEYMKFENGWQDGHIELCEHRLDQPLHWRKPCRIFVCSMSDLFHPKVPFEFIYRVLNEGILAAPHHTYLILTKRVKRMAKFIGDGLWSRNIHLGVSISNQAEADEKIPILLQIPAAVRFLSIEPMLGAIDINKDYYDGFWWGDLLRWVVVGCESGPKHRPCKIEWVQSIVDQCKAAGVACFVKQINVNGKVIKMPKGFPQELPNS